MIPIFVSLHDKIQNSLDVDASNSNSVKEIIIKKKKIVSGSNPQTDTPYGHVRTYIKARHMGLILFGQPIRHEVKF